MLINLLCFQTTISACYCVTGSNIQDRFTRQVIGLRLACWVTFYPCHQWGGGDVVFSSQYVLPCVCVSQLFCAAVGIRAV